MNFEQVEIGCVVRKPGSFSLEDVQAFARISGDSNPVHLDEKFAAQSIFGKRIVHGILSASLISAAIGTELCGPGVIYLSQELRFRKPVFIDEKLIAEVTVVEKLPEKNDLILKTEVINEKAELVISGTARVRLPVNKGI